MILVAGGTGHLGIPLVQHLASRGERVRVLTHRPRRAGDLLAQGVELVEGDVCIASSLAAAVAGVDTVVSAVTGFGPGGRGPRAVDLQGNVNLIAAAEAAGVRRFVLVSINGAREDHPLELYRAKFHAEQRLLQSRLEWTVIRPGVFMELWAGIVGDGLTKGGKATVFGQGDNPINFVSVRDIARFIALAVADRQAAGLSLDVGGPEDLTLNGIVEILARANGLQARARHVPLAALRAGALLLRHVRPDLAGLVEAAAFMDCADMTVDSTDLARRYPGVDRTRFSELASRHTAAVR